MTARFRTPSMTTALALLTLAVLVGCKEATVGPAGRGAIEGRVLDYETGAAIEGASVSTTPPSEALLSDSTGAFRLSDLDEGSYQVTARKSGFDAATVAVAVREDRPATAMIYLREVEDSVAPVSAVEARVTSFWRSVVGDSAFAEAEYRVDNTGEVNLEAYEVYFRIETPADTFYHEEPGGPLAPGEGDVQHFKAYIRDLTITTVVVDGIWTDPPVTG